MLCPYCQGELRGQAFALTGTRDNFGVGKAFVNKRTGQVIDNWHSWEKAGYTDATTDGRISGDLKAQVKRKVDKIGFDNKRRFSVKV